MFVTKTIMVVEREVNSSKWLKAVFGKQGYNIVPVYSYSCFQRLKKISPDVAMIDITIPNEYGFYVLRKIKEIFLSLPLIAIDSNENPLNKKELERLGARGVVTKPLDLVSLRKMIDTLCGSNN
ncbi:MAG: response regulator [Candidatus Omnitrophota bacterium]